MVAIVVELVKRNLRRKKNPANGQCEFNQICCVICSTPWTAIQQKWYAQKGTMELCMSENGIFFFSYQYTHGVVCWFSWLHDTQPYICIYSML